jgi:protein-S-isoprenylcysteine O-methyltransferase Ste14
MPEKLDVESLAQPCQIQATWLARRRQAVGEVLGVLSFLVFDRLLPVCIWGFFASAAVGFLCERWGRLCALARAQQCMSLLFMTMLVVLFLVRRRRWGRRSNIVQRGVALAGTFLPLLIVGWSAPIDDPLVLSVGALVTLVGMAWSVLALAYLGRCLAIFPEVRGLVTTGPYRLIRHPLYLGEIVGTAGLVIVNPSWRSIVVFGAFAALEVWRAINEERALLAEVPRYKSYLRRTKRLLPWIW